MRTMIEIKVLMILC